MMSCWNTLCKKSLQRSTLAEDLMEQPDLSKCNRCLPCFPAALFAWDIWCTRWYLLPCFCFPRFLRFPRFSLSRISILHILHILLLGLSMDLEWCKDLSWSLDAEKPLPACRRMRATYITWVTENLNQVQNNSEEPHRGFNNDTCHCHRQSTRPQKRNEKEMHCLKTWDVSPWLRTVMSLFVAIERTLCSVMREMRWHSWKSHGSDEQKQLPSLGFNRKREAAARILDPKKRQVNFQLPWNWHG